MANMGPCQRTVADNGIIKSFSSQASFGQKIDMPETMSSQGRYNEKGVGIQQTMQRRCVRRHSHAGDRPGTCPVGWCLRLLGFS